MPDPALGKQIIITMARAHTRKSHEYAENIYSITGLYYFEHASRH